MAASIPFINSALDGMVVKHEIDFSGYQVALFEGVTEATGNGYARATNLTGASKFNAAAAGSKSANETADFTASGGNISYDTVKLFDGSAGTTELHSIDVGSTIVITNGATEQITIRFTGT
jgi:hypothetical protein